MVTNGPETHCLVERGRNVYLVRDSRWGNERVEGMMLYIVYLFFSCEGFGALFCRDKVLLEMSEERERTREELH
jgi:hypothetical protein